MTDEHDKILKGATRVSKDNPMPELLAPTIHGMTLTVLRDGSIVPVCLCGWTGVYELMIAHAVRAWKEHRDSV